MKLEFKHVTNTHIKDTSVFYLYGNYKASFFLFCNFICEKLSESGIEHEKIFVSLSDFLKTSYTQCDLFATKINCFFIRGIDDNSVEKLAPFLHQPGSIFILESGDYTKSKKVTERYLASDNIYSIASFKNDITISALCSMLLPNISRQITAKIINLLNQTEEEPLSFFKKITLLIDGDNTSLLDEYVTSKKSFLCDMEPIALERYLLNTLMKEKIRGSASNPQFNLSKQLIVEKLLNAEMKIKSGHALPKSYIFMIAQ